MPWVRLTLIVEVTESPLTTFADAGLDDSENPNGVMPAGTMASAIIWKYEDMLKLNVTAKFDRVPPTS